MAFRISSGIVLSVTKEKPVAINSVPSKKKEERKIDQSMFPRSY